MNKTISLVLLSATVLLSAHRIPIREGTPSVGDHNSVCGPLYVACSRADVALQSGYNGDDDALRLSQRNVRCGHGCMYGYVSEALGL